jgi:hypothetical protein
MIWLSYVTGPNGPSIKIFYTAIVDIDTRERLEILRSLFSQKEGLDVKILCRDDLKDLYHIARIDPDVVEIVLKKNLCALMISANAKAMGSR